MVSFLVGSSKKEITLGQVSKRIGIAQRAVWFLLQTIALVDDHLNGAIEADEVCVAEEKNNYTRNCLQGKQAKPVISAIIIKNNKWVKAVYPQGAQPLISQQNISYKIGKDNALMPNKTRVCYILDFDYNHKAVDYSKGQDSQEFLKILFKIYVSLIEGFSSRLTRGVNGIDYLVSKKGLQACFNRFIAISSRKKLQATKRFLMFLKEIKQKNILYKELISY